MESERFEWDDTKAARNRIKHDVDFYEGITVFDDVFGLEVEDLAHSGDEPRLILIGCSILGRVLLVVYTERVQQKGAIRRRIIGARKATPAERRNYESQREATR